MAEINPDTTTGEQASGSFLNTAGHSVVGFKHVTLPFLSANAVDGADTYTPGGSIAAPGEVRVARAAWEGTTSGDECAVTHDGVTVTFNASTDNIEGYLHLWITG